MSEQKNKPENPPAFPCPVGHIECQHPAGMSLRDYFAIEAAKVFLNALINSPEDRRTSSAEDMFDASSEQGYRFADRMLSERSKRQETK